MPAVSVIVPVYNAEKYLHQCIDSIITQTFKDFELILVDDCSPDSCPTICDEYIKKDNRIKIIHNAVNRGSSASRRIGLEISSGEYIQFIDADDWIDETMIDKMYKRAIVQDLCIVVCDVLIVNGAIASVQKQKFSGYDKISVIKDILSGRVSVYLNNKLVKRDLYLRAEFPRWNISEDSVISTQIFYNSNRVESIDESLYNYRYNEQSLTRNTDRRIANLIEENRNWRILMKFLRGKYQDISIFEPELNSCMNIFEEKYLQDNDLRRMKELNNLFIISYGFIGFCKRRARRFLRIKRDWIKTFIKRCIKKFF